MEMRAPIINGRTDTIKDSVDFNSSKGNMNSINLNSPNRAKPKAKRESIYKTALMQQLKNANLSQFSAGKNSSIASDDDSDEDSDDRNKPGSGVRKSRFGQI